MPKLTADLFGAPEGEVYPRTFAAGEECPASLEEAARALGILAEDRDAKARKGAPENKARP
jgi:hypothetical protein